MPDTVSLGPEPVITDRQKRREEKDRLARRDYSAGIDAALQSAPTADFVNFFYRGSYDYDPLFKWDRALIDQFADGIDGDLIGQFADAGSMDEAQFIRLQLLQKTDHRRALADLGWTGQALVMAANILDPTLLAAGVATSGAAHFAAIGAATRGARLVRMGLITGGGFGAFETARAAVNPEIGITDILAATAGGAGFGVGAELTRGASRLVQGVGIGASGAIGPVGVEAVANQFRDEEQRRSLVWNGATNFILGGLLSVLTPSQRRAAAGANPELYRASGNLEAAGRRMQRDVEYRTAVDAGATITPQGERYFKDQLATPESRYGPVVAAADDSFTAAEEALGAAINRIEKARAADIARTPLDKGGGLGYLPPVVASNQVTGWIAESPHARINFEAARADANLARRANPDARISVVEYPGGGFAAFREWTAATGKGTGPYLPTAPKAVVPPSETPTAAPGPRPAVQPVAPASQAAKQPFTQRLYRGIKEPGQKPADPGDFGVGEYHTSSPHLANQYGKLTEIEVTLRNPLRLSEKEAYEQIADRFGTIHGVPGKPNEHAPAGEARQQASEAATEWMRSQGYDGLIVTSERGELEVVKFPPAAKQPATPLSAPLSQRLNAAADAALERIKARSIPRGPDTGATTIFDDAVDATIWAAAKIASGTVRGVEAVAKLIGDTFPHLSSMARSIADEAVARATKPESLPDLDAAPNRAEIAATFARTAEPQAITGQAMGAATPEVVVPPPAPQQKVGDMDFSNVSDSPPMHPKLLGLKLPRFDMPAMIGNSPAKRIVKAGNIFGKDPLPKSDGTISNYSAPEQVHDRTVSLRARLLTRMDAIYAEHRAERGDLALPREVWNEATTRAWRRAGRSEIELEPVAKKAAATASALIEEVHGFAQRHRVPGFETLEHNPGYVPRLWRQDKIDPAVTRFGPGQVADKLLGPSVRGGEWDLTADESVSYAKAIIKNGGRKLSPSELERGRLYADQPERLAEMLKDADHDLTDEQVARIVGKIMPRKEAAGTPTRARQRISMDETFEADLIDPVTNEVVRVSVESLLENNVEVLVSKYAHQLYGQSALHTGFRALDPANPATSIRGQLTRLENDADALGALKDQQNNLNRLEVMMKITGGIPLQDDNVTRQVVRSMVNMNYIRTMSNVGTGIQNFAEANQSMNELGWVNVNRHMLPALEIFKRSETGEMTTPLLRELEAIGIGLDTVVNRVHPRMLGEDGILAATGRAEYWSAKGARWASNISLQSYGQVVLEATVGPTVMQTFADIARGGKGFNKFRRLAAGLDESMADRISAAIRDPDTGAVFKQDGTLLYDLRVENWTDVQAASAFRGAVSKITHRLALKVNPTELALWMHSDAGRLMIFLRRFLIGSYTNKTLFEYAAKDSIAAKNVVVGLLATGLTYMARTYLNSVGRPDADEYRRKMLSPERIATAAIGRAPFSSFIPAVVDTAANLTGRPEVFSHARTSGLRASLIGGNPIVDWGLAAYNTPRAFIGPIWTDYDFSRQDLNNIANGLWIPNVLGARAVLEQLGANLPAQSRQQENDE